MKMNHRMLTLELTCYQNCNKPCGVRMLQNLTKSILPSVKKMAKILRNHQNVYFQTNVPRTL